MKKLALLISSVVLLSLSINVQAEETESATPTKYEAKKMEMQETREENKMKRDEIKADTKENRMEASENRKTFRSENSEELKEVKSSLTDEQKEDLEALREEYKEDREELVAEIKEASSEEDREELVAELEALAAAQFEKAAEILGEDAAELLQKREDVYAENKALREENRETRSEYRSERKEQVEKYRQNFIKRLGNGLDNLSTEKLEEILERIDTFIVKYEENENISDTRKDRILDQLAALKVIIEEELESDDEEADVLDVMDELLAE